MPTPSSSYPPQSLYAHTQFNPNSACPHPVQGPPLHAHTQFKAVHPNPFMPTPSSRLLNPNSACPHPVQGYRTPPLHAHTQFKAVEPHLCMVQGGRTPSLAANPNLFMPTPSSRLSNPTSACPHPVQGCQTPPLHDDKVTF